MTKIMEIVIQLVESINMLESGRGRIIAISTSKIKKIIVII
jgi:hypothetical protein